MKANYFLLNKVQYALFVLVLITTLVISTRAAAEAGALDPTFGTDGIVTTDLGSPSDFGSDIALQPDGKIVILGSMQIDDDYPYHRASIILRYNADGTPDAAFGTGGKLTPEFGGMEIALQTDGKLIVGGSSGGDFALARYTRNGTLDTTFGINGIATVGDSNGNFSYLFGDLAIQPDGKIVIAGTQETGGHHYPSALARFNADGTLDEESGFYSYEFPDGLQHSPQGVAFQSDGRIIMSGDMISEEGVNDLILGRFIAGPDSWIDSTFGVNGTVVIPLEGFSHARGALAIQANDKIVIAGTMTNSYQPLMEDLFVARFNSNGTLDTTLAGSGILMSDLGQNEQANDVAVQRDGKIIVAGTSSSGDSDSFLLVRYNSDGSLDIGFGDEGRVITTFDGSSASAEAVALQVDGKILATGGKDEDALLARYEGTLPPTTTVIFNSKAASDGWILESTESSNIGGTLNKTATTFYVGDDPKDKQYRAIISFNTVSLPDNAFIVSAQVKVKRQGVVGTDPFTTHGKLLLEIRNGLFNNDLDLRVGDFAAAPSSSIRETITPLTSSWYAASLSSSNLGFVNKYGVTQFRLRFKLDDNDDLSADYMKFFTGESITANQPQLIVTYVLP